jgi:hypothetical protein
MHDFLSHNAVIRRAVHITEDSSGDLYSLQNLSDYLQQLIGLRNARDLIRDGHKKTSDRDISPLPPVFKTNIYYKTQRLLDILA